MVCLISSRQIAMNHDLQSRIEKILSERIKSIFPVSGGSIADSCKLVLNSGRALFLKQLRSSSSGLFASEAQESLMPE